MVEIKYAYPAKLPPIRSVTASCKTDRNDKGLATVNGLYEFYLSSPQAVLLSLNDAAEFLEACLKMVRQKQNQLQEESTCPKV